MQMHALVVKEGLFDMQVCVPEGWTDEEVKSFADAANPSGTSGGWAIRKSGDPALLGAPERVPCASRPGFVHVMLDAES